MNTNEPKELKGNHNIDISLNATQANELFKRYLEAGFLYPEKLARLTPYFQIIKDNWNALIDSKESVLYVLTANCRLKKKFASITLWRNGMSSIFSQHLVSTGNPRLSLLLMLESMRTIQWDTDNSNFSSSQNWFRLSNRYARRVFASSHKIIGEAHSSLIPFQYLMLPLTKVEETTSKFFKVEEISKASVELNNFISKKLNPVFIKAEELDSDDILFTELNKKYAGCNLQRRRLILKVTDSETNEIQGCIIANRAPLGLNFSFLENRAYYILNHKLDMVKVETMLKLVNCKLQSFYQDFELQAIPIVTDQETAQICLDNHASFIREYTQVIWLKEGASKLKKYFNSLLERISRGKN